MKIKIVFVTLLLLLFGCGCDDIIMEQQVASFFVENREQFEPLSENEDNSEQYASLFFNDMQPDSYLHISPVPAAFFWELTEEQLNIVFPFFDMNINANASYEEDSSLIEVGAVIPIPGNEYDDRIEIYMGLGEIRFDLSGPVFGLESGFVLPDNLKTSMVHGVVVKAVKMKQPFNELYFFQTEFEIASISFRVKFQETSDAGEELMTYIVNRLILGGVDGLVILTENVIRPEIRNDVMDLEEAKLDPDFGYFVPLNVPSSYQFDFGTRAISQHANILYLQWQTRWDYDYVVESYEHWLANRTVTTAPFDLNDVYIEAPQLRWVISFTDEHTLSRVVSIHDPESYALSEYPLKRSDDSWLRFHDMPLTDTLFEPVFLAEELTYEAIMSREWQRVWIIQAADGADSDDMMEIYFPLEVYELKFGILFNNIVVSVHSEGLTALQICDILEGVFALQRN